MSNRINWATHFRDVSKRPRAQAEFGTIGGLYTIAELRDLVTAKDSDMANLATITAQYFPNWQKSNPNDANAWHADYSRLLSRYADAKTKANLVINGSSFSLIPDNMVPADDTYKALLAAVNPMWQQNTNSPDSLGGLNARIGLATGATGNNLPATPQPKGGSDYDINAMSGISKASTYVPSPIKTAVATIDPSLIPQDKTSSQYQPFDAKKFAKDHWEGLTIGGIGLVVILKVMAKFGL